MNTPAIILLQLRILALLSEIILILNIIFEGAHILQLLKLDRAVKIINIRYLISAMLRREIAYIELRPSWSLSFRTLLHALSEATRRLLSRH